MNAWGELCDEAPERRPAGKLAIERADALPEKQRRRRYALMAGAALALAAVALAGGTCAAMSSTAKRPGRGGCRRKPAIVRPGERAGAPVGCLPLRQHLEMGVPLRREQGRFRLRFDAYAEELGLGDGRPCATSRIEADAGVYTAWLSLPVGERFFKVTFVARDKSFAFEECAMPEGLPEVNYSSVEAQADSQTESQAETPAGEEQAYPSQADSSYMSVDRGAARRRGRRAAFMGALRLGVLAFEASSDPRPRPSFPAPSRAGSRAKGYAAEASACQIDLASVSDLGPHRLLDEMRDVLGRGLARLRMERCGGAVRLRPRIENVWSES